MTSVLLIFLYPGQPAQVAAGESFARFVLMFCLTYMVRPDDFSAVPCASDVLCSILFPGTQ